MVCRQRRRRVKAVQNINVEHPDIDLIKYALDVIAKTAAGSAIGSIDCGGKFAAPCVASWATMDWLCLITGPQSRRPTPCSDVLRSGTIAAMIASTIPVATIFYFAGLADPSWRQRYEKEQWQEFVKNYRQSLKKR